MPRNKCLSPDKERELTDFYLNNPQYSLRQIASMWDISKDSVKNIVLRNLNGADNPFLTKNKTVSLSVRSKMLSMYEDFVDIDLIASTFSVDADTVRTLIDKERKALSYKKYQQSCIEKHKNIHF